MTEAIINEATLTYVISNQIELNLSYMPFITNGGIFIPTNDSFNIGQIIEIDLQLPGENAPERIEGKVVWIMPKNPHYGINKGIGIQLTGINAKKTRDRIVAGLDTTMETGGYSYGILGESQETITIK